MSEKDMARETRLVRRKGGRYYFRAFVPEDLRDFIPGGRSGQKWIALSTSDYAEAVRLSRVKSMEFDRKLEVARKRITGTYDTLSDETIRRLTTEWLAYALGEDEEERRETLNADSWEEKQEAAEKVDAEAGHFLARGNLSFIDAEIEEILLIEGLVVENDSDSWRRLGFELLKAQKRLGVALLKRQAGEIVETPTLPTAKSASSGITIAQLIDQYVADPKRKRTAGTLKTYRTVFRALKELLGPETSAKNVHRRDCERVRDLIVRLPKHASQRFKNTTLEQAAKIADAEKLERMKPATVNSYLANLSAVFKWGVKNWRIDRNPAESLMVHDPVADIDRRIPFSVDQLQTIFNAILYTGCQDDERGYASPGPNVIRRGRFWVPLLSLWTGMRLGECCQLYSIDVVPINGVHCILIDDASDPGADESDRKRVKTAAGKRFVPVHPELQRLGFLDFVAAKQREGTKRLFPEIVADAQGFLSGSFSKWFNDKSRFLGKLGLSGQGVSFHSFRHNYRDALREADISTARVRALGGWRRDSDGEEARYGKGLEAATLNTEIQKVSYPGLDLSHLYPR